MNTHDKPEWGITLIDAVEALSSIAESHWEEAVSVERAEEGPLDFGNALWLRNRDRQEVVSTVKEIFKVILNHIKNFYHTDYAFVTDSKSLEGIKAIMVLVGEAAKKIDRHTDIFHLKTLHSVTQLREYKLLQDFYRRKISRTIDEALLGKWILALTQRTFREHERVHAEGIRSLETKHVFVDLDSVKKDTEYELFFIRKEDGSRFFSPRLIRNIKLVCDFGAYLGMEKEKDPFAEQEIWQDRVAQAKAEAIFQKIKPVLASYYPDIVQGKADEWIAILNKALIALIAAASKSRLISAGSSKGCAEYLSNFQEFLRAALQHEAYQHLLVFPSKKQTPAQEAATKVIEALLGIIMKGVTSLYAVHSYLHYLIDESQASRSVEHQREAHERGVVWSQLAADYTAMQKLMRRHPNGPLNRVLGLLEDGNYQIFDPYMQQQIPECVFTIHDKEREVSVITCPTPTSQEFIQEAKVNEEFLTALRSLKEDKILLINLQDSTSWREFGRVKALENLQTSQCADKLTLVTLAKDTEFYQQEPPYQEDHQVKLFKEHLQEHLLDSQAGFLIPAKLQKEVNKGWIESACHAISRVFFSGKNVLAKEARLDFIELFYLFLMLKLIEISKSKTVLLVCKDGVDVAPATAALLFLFLKLVKADPLSLEEMQRVTAMLYVPALIVRERLMLPERFQRLLGVVKVIEHARQEHGVENFVKLMHKAFGELYNSKILSALPRFMDVKSG